MGQSGAWAAKYSHTPVAFKVLNSVVTVPADVLALPGASQMSEAVTLMTNDHIKLDKFFYNAMWFKWFVITFTRLLFQNNQKVIRSLPSLQGVNTLGWGIFKLSFFVCKLPEIWQKFIPKSPTNNTLALVKIMAWCQTDNKPLSEPMMQTPPVYMLEVWPSLLMHIDGLVQDCSNSSALAMELLQSYTTPSIHYLACMSYMRVNVINVQARTKQYKQILWSINLRHSSSVTHLRVTVHGVVMYTL